MNNNKICEYRNITGSILLVALLSTGIAGAAYAAEISADFRVGGGETDNIARSSTNPVESSITIAGFDFNYFDESSRYLANVVSSVDYVDFGATAYDSRVIGGIFAYVDYSMVQDRLNWIVQNNFGQIFINPLATPNVNNLENVNVLTTGPDVTIPLGARTFVGLDARYSWVTYEEGFDEDRTSATLRLGRNIRQDLTLTFNATHRKINYETGATLEDYTVREVYGRLESNAGRNIFGIDAGYTELERGTSIADGPLFGVDWTRNMTDVASFQLTAGSRYFDRVNTFERQQDFNPDIGDVIDTDGTGNPYLNNYFGATYSLAGTRTQLDLQAGWSQEDYKDGSGDDRDMTRLIFNVQRDLTRYIFGGLNLRYLVREYKYLSRTDNDGRYSVNLGLRIGQSFTISADYAYFERRSDSAVDEYTENRYMVYLRYIPGWGR